MTTRFQAKRKYEELLKLKESLEMDNAEIREKYNQKALYVIIINMPWNVIRSIMLTLNSVQRNSAS